ncbi:RNA-splicing ligase RtcB [Longibacter salinarum]|uniref:tRNA-splicing ligase RtcB n=1 Tax=Longibacter salinarum TaxID=1850348 RepID=A0A2A8CWU9_9BACT|nr:RtcB family protein [Longibacter salinarum]PEN13103.1 RNA-splicing ligase RtcB [Longibacter salinarum]
MDRKDLTRIDDYTWEIPQSFREGMRVPIRILANEELVDDIITGEAIEQAVQTAHLPGLVGHLVVMPDVYSGQGAPVGIVAASKYPAGAIAPGAIGHDINTGVRLLGSSIKRADADDLMDELADKLHEFIPCGVDAEGSLQLSKSEIDHVAQSGAQWALRKDMAKQDDLVRAEEGGRLNEANPSKVSETARALGAQQLGTLGGGEHFIEISYVDEVFNRAAAITMGLKEGRLTAQIHCGSRGYGRQVCADYIERFQDVADKYDAHPPNPNLAFVPLDASEAEDYMGAMRAAANYAYANRQVLAHRVREAFDEVIEGGGDSLRTVYDVAHNLGQVEMHEVEGKHMRCYVHRKGAARAFGPGTPGISLPYRALGQPVIVPGSMGETSWVMLATRDAMSKSFGSACHGAGRTMSRHEASYQGEAILDDQLENRGVRVRSGDTSTSGGVQLKENIDAVVDTVSGAGLAGKVARLKPLAVVHG